MGILSTLATAGALVATLAAPNSTPTDGVPTVGALFHDGGNGSHFCSASVITSAHHNLLVTAAHCLLGQSNLAFVPNFHNGVRPYGTWKLTKFTIDPLFVSNHNINRDFAFAEVAPVGGKQIQDVVGSNALRINQGFTNKVTVIGYPSSTNRAVICSNTTKRYQNYAYQVEFDCAGYPGGTSGSPWLLDYNSSTHHGYVNGVIGGYNGGGPNDDISTTSYFDNDIQKDYDNAQR